jgi:thiamine biosynthesis lipoprotein
MKFIRIIASALFFALMISCTAKSPRDYLRVSGFAQGTTYSILYFDSQKRDFSEEIERLLLNIDNSMSVYNPESTINGFNNSENGFEIDTLLAEVVILSQKYWEETNGAFDITVGPLVSAWGFHAKQGGMPTDEEIKKLIQNIGNDKIALNNLYLSKTQPGVKIDVNAVAQGYTVDVIADFLEDKEVTDYLVELGGEIRTSGKSSRGSEWIVGVDKPVDDAISGEQLQVKLKITSGSLVTSGNYRKYFVKDGVKYSHTIDPKTGYPVTHSVLSTTVLDKVAARADALATTFMVMGLDATQKWLEKNPEVDVYIVYSDEKGDYRVWMSKGIKERVID